MTSSTNVEHDCQIKHLTFFQLPREVRDEILFYFCCDKEVIINKKKPPPPWHDSKRGKRRKGGKPVRYYLGEDPRISSGTRQQPCPYVRATQFLPDLQVSHQFYEEATAVFYSSSIFLFEYIVPFRSFLERLPIRYPNLLRELTLSITVREVDTWQDYLEGKAATHLAGLRNIHIQVEVPTIPWASFKDPADYSIDLTDLVITSSTSLPLLQKALISTVYRNAHYGEEPYLKEYVDELFARLARGMR